MLSAKIGERRKQVTARYLHLLSDIDYISYSVNVHVSEYTCML